MKVYTRNLVPRLLALDSPHEFVLLYRDSTSRGGHADGERVREVVLKAPSAFLWDQISVARVARRERLDVIFNPKYSVPLSADAATVFVCHGLDWFVSPEWSRWRDRLSHRLLVPRYAESARAIIAVSETARHDAIRFLGVNERSVTTVYHGVEEAFRRPVGHEELERVKRRYALPERFYLYCGQIYPPKNFGRLVRAFARATRSNGLGLVVAGTHTWRSEDELALIDRLGLEGSVSRLGWVPREDLPPLYSLAEALVMPSLYESFGFPLLEAMSAGCPIVTSDRGGTREIAGDAGLLVDPEDVHDIAAGMRRVVDDASLRGRLVEAGRRRAAGFSWAACARRTLRVLEASAS